MDIIHIILFGIITALIYLSIKDIQPNIAFVIILTASIIILFGVVKQLQTILSVLRTLGEKATIQSYYLDTIFKIIGIAYITELGANMIKDAGLTGVSSKIELAGKIFILLLAIPIIQAVIETILQFIPVADTLNM